DRLSTTLARRKTLNRSIVCGQCDVKLSRSPLLGSLPLAIAEIPAERRQYRSWLRFRDSYRQTPYGRAKRPIPRSSAISEVRGCERPQVGNHRCEISGWSAKALKNMVARDGVEPPTPAFSEPTF